jgi:gamma-glutamylaminecyclotransferase
VSDQRYYVFVYGTLKRGQRNHGLLAGQPFVRDAVTEPFYRLYDCGPYPGLVELGPGGAAVEGEIYLVDDPTLEKLDELEAVPVLYQRGPVRLRDCELPVLAYYYVQEVSRFPECGRRWPAGS